MDNEKRLTIKEWADEDKPREKLLQKGRKELTNTELLAILLRSGVPGNSVMELSKKILDDYQNDLHELSKATIEELNRYKGMGDTKSITIIAALELGRRLLDDRKVQRIERIRGSEDFFHYLAPFLIDLPHEEFWAVFLDARSKIIGRQRIAVGGITQTSVDIRLIFKPALEKNAVKLLVAHNHPTGNLEPSQMDKELTKAIAEAGKILNITLVDHMIVGIQSDNQADFYSFCESGLL